MSAAAEALSEAAERAITGQDIADLRHQAIGLGLWELVRQRLQRIIPLASPIAGADWTINVPSGSTWEILWASGRFTTSAVVATRVPELRVLDTDGTIAYRFPAQGSQPASQAVVQSWGKGYGVNVNAGGVGGMSLPLDYYVPGGYTVRSFTFNLDAGDAWAFVTLSVREWSLSRIVQAVSQTLIDLESLGRLR